MIYKTLSIEQPVPSSAPDVEAHHAKLDSGRELFDSVADAREKDRAEITGDGVTTKSVDNDHPNL